MDSKDRELMERYIYQVIRRLPKAQREEVALELRELIGDMAERSGSVTEALTKLGDPAEFAKQYQDGGHYLIGPEYYENYIWFLKIVLLCSAIPVLAVAVIEGIQNGAGLTEANVVQAAVTSAIHGIVNGLVNLIISCVSVFGGVTLIFAIMERQKIKFEVRQQKKWSVGDLGTVSQTKQGWTPRNLAPLPHKKSIISRGDSIVGIVFLVIFGVLLIIAPQFFSAVFKDGDGIRLVPLFHLEQWHRILPLLIISLTAGLTDEIIRLVTGRYCKPVMISNIVCNVIQIIFSFAALKVLPIWNPNFADELKAQLGNRVEGAAWFIDKWNGDMTASVIFTLIVIISLAEIGTAVYKYLRYGEHV